MQTLILPFTEADTEIIKFINRLRRQKKAFEIQPLDVDFSNSVWDFKEPDTDFEKLGTSVLAADWDSPEDDHWNAFYQETKPIAAL